MRLLQIDFNPRSPHRERHEFSKLFAQHEKFQSTLPSQGATPRSCLLTFWIRNFNPRSPHRERPDRRRYIVPVSNFNPRSPHRERLIRRNKLPELVIFQSTLPSQGATITASNTLNVSRISIHAPLTGSDWLFAPSISLLNYFNPRSPHRERPLL